MTVQEVISIIKSIRKEYEKKKFGVEAIDISIQSVEEVEQYRALGTVEGFQKALDSSLEYYIQMKEYKAKLQEYEALGTVEERKEAREKQVAKKPKVKPLGEDIEVECPVCGHIHIFLNAKKGDKYCNKCGQALKWEEGGTSD